MKIKDKRILKELNNIYNTKSLKYDVLSKTFIYNSSKNNEVCMTFDTLLNNLDKNENIYSLLDSLNSSYFPRRLKEVIVTFYKENNINLPKSILLGEKGFEIVINDKIQYIEYFDDFNIFLKEMAKLYDINYKEITINPNIEDYKGHYHHT